MKQALRNFLISRTTTVAVALVSAATAVWDVFDVILTDTEGTIGAEHGFALYATFSAVSAVLEATGGFVEEVQELLD